MHFLGLLTEAEVGRRLTFMREELARYMPKRSNDDSLLFKWYLQGGPRFDRFGFTQKN